MKRRIFCAVMTVVLVLTMLPVIVAAEGAVEIAFTQRETKAGATQVQVGVDMSNNPGLVTATIPVTWDNDVLHLVDVIPSENILSAGWIGMSMDEYQSNGTYYLAWDNDLAKADFTTEVGCLAELVFDIVDPSKDTNTTLAFDMDDPIANVMNFDMEDLRETVTVNAANGTVSVAAEAGGDDPVTGDVIYTLKDVVAKPGDNIKVAVEVDASVAWNSIALRDLEYDSSVLTFNGFELSEDIDSSGAIFKTVDNTKGTVSIGFMQASVYDYVLCYINFTVNPNAADGKTNVSINAITKNSSTELSSGMNDATVVIKQQVLGDINGDESVSIDDAIALFQYSMMPDMYPVEYVFRMDFDKDNDVDIDDAILLFQYSMMPDMYPIEY